MTEKEAVNFLIESALEKYTVELRECNKIGNDRKSKEESLVLAFLTQWISMSFMLYIIAEYGEGVKQIIYHH